MLSIKDSELAVEPKLGSAERFFQWSLYVLLVTGFVALMGTNRLDFPSLALVIPALLVRGYCLLMRNNFTISERWTTLLTLAYIAFYAADYFYFSQSFISATVHLVLFSMVMKIFSVRRDRDLMYLAVLSFLMVLAAAVLTVDTLFLLTFSLFILVAIATFVSMEMRRSERETQAAGVPVRLDARFQRSLAGMSTVLGVLTLLGAAAIFFVIPRLNTAGYLRNFGVQGSMYTGFSQDVNLGGIGQIQQSDAVVMHVKVLWGRLPREMKWRGVALANFDGQRWWNNTTGYPAFHGLNNVPLDLTQLYQNSTFYSGAVAPAPTVGYRIVMEPTGLNLFFMAPIPLRINGEYRIVAVTQDGAVYNSGASKGELVPESETGNIGSYEAESDARDPEPLVRNSTSNRYPPRVALLYLQLPHVDPRVLQLTRQIIASANSNYERARAIEKYLSTNYGYTLQLPGGRHHDQVAYFLFERKKGHCEYFASSMAVMLRIAGIPARVVNGFRGGEYNDLTGNYIIREKDAHSWVEAYFPEYGWVTFDPTPSANVIEGSGGSWSRLALYMDAAREAWREWVINYDFSHQMRLSAQLSNETGSVQSRLRVWVTRKYKNLVHRVQSWQRGLARLSPEQMVMACILLGILLALPFTPRAWRSLQRTRALRNPHRAPRTSASFWYLRLLKKLARQGFRKAPEDTPVEFAASIGDPEIREDVVVFTHHYQRARFDASVPDAERLPELYEEITAKK